MYVTPPPPPVTHPVPAPAWWQVAGPGFAALIGLFMLTAIYRFDGMSDIQRALHLSGQGLLLIGLVSYLVAAAVAVPAGLLLGGRFPTAVTIPALFFLFIGVLLAAFADAGGLLMVGRAFAGFGTGAALGAAIALIRKLRGGRGLVAGVLAALGVLALLLAPVVGQVISDAMSFRTVQLAAVPFLLVALIANAVIGLVKLTSARRPVPPIPYPPQTSGSIQ